MRSWISSAQLRSGQESAGRWREGQAVAPVEDQAGAVVAQASAELIDNEHGDQRDGVANPRQKVHDAQIGLVDPIAPLGHVHHLEPERPPAARREGLVVVETVPAGD